MLNLHEVQALAQVVQRAPLSKAEELWATQLFDRLFREAQAAAQQATPSETQQGDQASD